MLGSWVRAPSGSQKAANLQPFFVWGENPSGSLLPRAERVYQVPDPWHSSSPKRITWICESTASTSLGAVFFIAHIPKYAPHKKTFLPSIYGTLTNPQFFTFHFWGENPSSSLLPRAERVYQVPDLWHSSSPKRITWICESTASTSLGAVFFIAHIPKAIFQSLSVDVKW